MSSYKYQVQKFPMENIFLENIAQFDGSQMEYSWNHKQWTSINVEKTTQYFLSTLMDGTELLAFALYTISFEQAHLLKIAVRQSLRKQNFATSLLENDVSNLKKMKVSDIYLEVAEKNLAANSFYIKHGFKILTVKKKFYSDGSNANAMSLQLK